MFKSYIKKALRNFYKHKVFSFINVSRLAIGMAGCILCHEQMASEFCLQDRYESVDIRAGCWPGAGHRFSHDQFPDHQSCHSQPGRFPAV
jgi:hypothetical protein